MEFLVEQVQACQCIVELAVGVVEFTESVLEHAAVGDSRFILIEVDASCGQCGDDGAGEHAFRSHNACSDPGALEEVSDSGVHQQVFHKKHGAHGFADREVMQAHQVGIEAVMDFEQM